MHYIGFKVHCAFWGVFTSISRARFEEMDLFRKTMEPVEKVLRDRGLLFAHFEHIYALAGGFIYAKEISINTFNFYTKMIAP